MLNNITLSVPRGVVYGLIRENGAGKTTLIRSLPGYHPLDSGSLEVSWKWTPGGMHCRCGGAWDTCPMR